MSKFLQTLQFKLSGREFVVQDILDQIVPGLLPLAVVMGVYWFYTKKGLKVTQALLMVNRYFNCLSNSRYFIKRKGRESDGRSKFSKSR